MKPIPTALTYDDVLLVPQYSEVVPQQVSTRSFLAHDIHLEVPLISSAMDTVTESLMAQVLAQVGGLGIIHKNLSVENQAREVERVKKYESGIITDPITLNPETSVRQAVHLMKEHSISGLPITVGTKLVGILTHRDIRFETHLDQPISNVMTKDSLITTPEGTSLEEARGLLQKHRIEKLLVVNGKFELRGLITVKDIEKSKTYPHASKDSQGRLLVGAALGADKTHRDRTQALEEKGVDVLVIDTAHGHSKNVFRHLKMGAEGILRGDCGWQCGHP